MPTILTQSFKSPLGELLLGSFEGKLCLCDWRYRRMRSAIDKRIQSGLSASYREQSNALLDEVQTPLQEYFSQQRKRFDLPLLLIGSDFQQAVWRALQNIPYAELAEQLGKASAVRAVGSANGANALSIIVPCHRLVGSKGELTGYAGGLNAKAKLLELESDLLSL